MSRIEHLDEKTLLDQGIVPWRQSGQFVYTWTALDLAGAALDTENGWARLILYEDRGDAFPLLDLENDEAADTGDSQISFPTPTTGGGIRFTAGVDDAPKAKRHRWHQIWFKPAAADRILVAEGYIDILAGGVVTAAGDPNL